MTLEQRKRVLVVEDEEALLTTLRDELEESGFLVEPSLTGEEAIRKIDENPPDAVMLDLLLSGGIDGLGVLSHLKESERTRDVPVIFLSNVGDDEKIRQALDLGADAYFLKTRYSLADLLDKLNLLLKTGR